MSNLKARANVSASRIEMRRINGILIVIYLVFMLCKFSSNLMNKTTHKVFTL